MLIAVLLRHGCDRARASLEAPQFLDQVTHNFVFKLIRPQTLGDCGKA